MQTQKYNRLVKDIAKQLDFNFCGVARAAQLDDDARRLENWLKKGMQGTMQYMENYFELRIDPTKLVPGAKSVITLLLNYFPNEKQEEDIPKISKYAYGKDYHDVIRRKLNIFLDKLRNEAGDLHGRGFVDSAPVLERTWAQRSGLGWVGKNGNLINKKMGSYFFIATLIIDLDIEPDDPFVADFCGTCTKCLDACPTDAILPDKIVDGSRCISYFTIELKEMVIPTDMKGRFEDWVFGCDICQDVCPWNRFSKPTDEKEFDPLPGILNISSSEWEKMSDEKFKEFFHHSPIKRANLKGMQRNIKFLKAD